MGVGRSVAVAFVSVAWVNLLRIVWCVAVRFMRTKLPFIVSGCIGLLFSPLHAQTPDEGQKVFVGLFSDYQKAESFEKRGNLGAAADLYEAVLKGLDGLAKKYPQWEPDIVKHRTRLTKQALDRLSPVREVAEKPASPPSAGEESGRSKPKSVDVSGLPSAPMEGDSGG
jgi:hypothetical protein